MANAEAIAGGARRAADCCLHVEVVYSPAAGEIDQVALQLPAGATVMQALQASGLFARHPRLATEALALGIWSRRTTPDAVLRDRDRVEVYRALTVDPKEARRLRYRGQAKARRPIVRRREDC